MLKRGCPSRRRLFAARLAMAGLIATAGYAAWAQRPAAAAVAPAAARSGSAAAQTVFAPPRYPVDALQRAQGGKVVVRIDVDAQGKPTHVQVETSEPQGVFDAAVLEAARGWRFRPSIRNGRAVAGRVRVPVTFAPGMQPVPPPAGHAGGDYAWYRLDWDPSDKRVCDVVLADADASPLCGIRKLAAR